MEEGFSRENQREGNLRGPQPVIAGSEDEERGLTQGMQAASIAGKGKE